MSKDSKRRNGLKTAQNMFLNYIVDPYYENVRIILKSAKKMSPRHERKRR